MKHSIPLVLLVPICVLANEPDWFGGYQNSINYQQTASACVDVNNDAQLAKVMAEAIAKGEMVQAFGGEVTATRKLITSIVESNDRVSITDIFNETVQVKSHNHLPALITIDSGQYNINGEEKHCVLLGLTLKKGYKNEKL